MSGQLDLERPEVLQDLQKALHEFASSASSALQAIEAEVKKTEEWLDERVRAWQRAVRQAEQEVQAARVALQRCLANRERSTDCSAYQQQVQQAQRKLAEAQHYLEAAQAWRSRVQQAAQEYAGQARRVKELAGNGTQRATSDLKGLAAKYGTVHGGGGGSGFSSQEGKHAYPYQKARKEFMRQSLDDPTVASHIKGWITQEIHQKGESGYWRSPPNYDVGHKTAGIDQASNLRWEYRDMNRSKGAKFHI